MYVRASSAPVCALTLSPADPAVCKGVAAVVGGPFIHSFVRPLAAREADRHAGAGGMAKKKAPASSSGARGRAAPAGARRRVTSEPHAAVPAGAGGEVRTSKRRRADALVPSRCAHLGPPDRLTSLKADGSVSSAIPARVLEAARAKKPPPGAAGTGEPGGKENAAPAPSLAAPAPSLAAVGAKRPRPPGPRVSWIDPRMCGTRKILRVDVGATGCVVSQVIDSYGVRHGDLRACNEALARAGLQIVDGHNLMRKHRRQMPGAACADRAFADDIVMLAIAADAGEAAARGLDTAHGLRAAVAAAAAAARLFPHSGTTLYDEMALFSAHGAAGAPAGPRTDAGRAASYAETRWIVGAHLSKLFGASGGDGTAIAFIEDGSSFAAAAGRDAPAGNLAIDEGAIVLTRPAGRAGDDVCVHVLPCSLEVDVGPAWASEDRLEAAIIIHEEVTVVTAARASPLPGTRPHHRPCLVLSASSLRRGHAVAAGGGLVRVRFLDGEAHDAAGQGEDAWVTADSVLVPRRVDSEAGWCAQEVVDRVMDALNNGRA